MQYDPITFRILWDRLIAITQDASATMERATFSPIVREGNDYACSLLDIHGRALAEPPHTNPAFTGTLPITVRHMLRSYPISELEPGDSIVTNDIWLGTGHLNDFNIATPIFDTSGRAVAIAASTAHISDIGGTINFGVARDVHEEGLRLPVTKIVRAGRLNEELLDFIRFNVRVPDEVMGDLTGMLAANRTMGDRLLELIEEIEIRDFTALSGEIHRRSEQAMRDAIIELPSGRYHGDVTFDGAGFPITIVVTVEISGGEIRVDFAGTSPQNLSTSLNVAMNYTYCFTVYPLKFLIHPRLPCNDGYLRLFKISAPPGSILNSQYPAAGCSRHYVGHMIHAAVFSALKGPLRDRIWGHSGSAPTGIEHLSGIRPDGRPFVHLFFHVAGTGACPAKDGEICWFPSNGRCTGVETTEHLAPVIFERKEIILDSAGPGKYRGGLGSRWTIKNIGRQPVLFGTFVGRLNYPAKGLLGGGDGCPNRLYLNDEQVTRGWGIWELQSGDSFTKELPGGGGLHSPLLRDPGLVLEDVLEGYVSAERAREDYGVIIENGTIVGYTTARAD
jgi:N-methylhydantoinase B